MEGEAEYSKENICSEISVESGEMEEGMEKEQKESVKEHDIDPDENEIKEIKDVTFEEQLSEYRKIKTSHTKTNRFVFTIKLIKFIVIVTLVLCFFLTEIVVGIATNTMTLIADSLHMLSDSFSFAIGLVALLLSVCPKKKSKNYSYGFVRAEVVGGLVNSVFFMSVVVFIITESSHRFIHPEPIEKPLLVLIVGIVGLIIDCLGLCMFSHNHRGNDHHTEEKKRLKKKVSKMTKVEREELEKYVEEKRKKIIDNYEYDVNTIENDPLLTDYPKEKSKKLKKLKREYEKDLNKADKWKKIKRPWNLNMMGVFFHVLGDTLSGMLVIVMCVVNMIWYPEFEDVHHDDDEEEEEEENIDPHVGVCVKNCFVPYIDPIISCLLAFVIFFATLPVLISSAKILMHRVPKTVNIEKLKTAIRRLKGVIDLHDVHVFTIVNEKYVCTMHVSTAENTNFRELTRKIQEILHEDFNIHASTIQPEFSSDPVKRRMKCVQRCVTPKCISKHCCPSEFYDEMEYFSTIQQKEQESLQKKKKMKKKKKKKSEEIIKKEEVDGKNDEKEQVDVEEGDREISIEIESDVSEDGEN